MFAVQALQSDDWYDCAQLTSNFHAIMSSYMYIWTIWIHIVLNTYFDTDSLAIICYHQVFFHFNWLKKRFLSSLQAKYQRRLDLAIEIEGRRGTRRIHVEGHGACTSTSPHASASASANTCTGAECWNVAGIWTFCLLKFVPSVQLNRTLPKDP